MGSAPRKQTKTYKTPKRPYEATRLDAELKVGFIARQICLPPSSGARVVETEAAMKFGELDVVCQLC